MNFKNLNLLTFILWFCLFSSGCLSNSETTENTAIKTDTSSENSTNNSPGGIENGSSSNHAPNNNNTSGNNTSGNNTSDNSNSTTEPIIDQVRFSSDQITITGTNLSKVSKAKLVGNTTIELTIISATNTNLNTTPKSSLNLAHGNAYKVVISN